MINIALKLKGPINYIKKNISNIEFETIALSELDWEALKELQEIFEVFIKASTKLQAQLYITVPKGLLYIYQIFKSLISLLERFSKEARKPNKVSYFSFFLLFLYLLLIY